MRSRGKEAMSGLRRSAEIIYYDCQFPEYLSIDHEYEYRYRLLNFPGWFLIRYSAIETKVYVGGFSTC